MTETKKGKWIKAKFNYLKRMYEPCEDNAVYGVKYICSECNNTAYSDSDWGVRLFPYCVKTPCEHCSCNPKNGGSGMCNCTLACPKIT